MLLLKDVCEKTGASRRAMQGFVKAGLIRNSGKNKYGYLLFEEMIVEQVNRILMYQSFGFTVNEIVEFDGLLETNQRKVLLRKAEGLEVRAEQIKKSINLIQEELKHY